MELGALICTPSSPSCQQCPVRPMCRAHQRMVAGEAGRGGREERGGRRCGAPFFFLVEERGYASRDSLIILKTKRERVVAQAKRNEPDLGGIPQLSQGKAYVAAPQSDDILVRVISCSDEPQSKPR